MLCYQALKTLGQKHSDKSGTSNYFIMNIPTKTINTYCTSLLEVAVDYNLIVIIDQQIANGRKLTKKMVGFLLVL